MSRCDELPMVLLAVMALGAVYVPIDPAYPRARAEWILADSQPELLVVDGNELAASLDTGCRRIAIQALEAGAVALHAGVRWHAHSADDLAYVIYTSGSTGRPKGVAIRHAGVSRLQRWAEQTYPVEALGNVFAGTSICFDLSVFETFVVWSLGGGITLGKNALDLIEDPRCGRVTLVNTVPSLFAELLRSARLPDGLRVVNLAGEPLPPTLVESIARQVAPGVRVYNLYGPSEDTTYSTWSLVDLGHPSAINIGRPLPGTAAHVLDARQRPIPDAFPGELHLSGCGLAAGYFNAPALTEERFLPAGPGRGRMYRTGDKVRRRADGCLEYLGRLDHQCKLRGFRIELLEVEAALRSVDGVADACSVVALDATGSDMLVAYVTLCQGVGFDEHRIRSALRTKLPDYMVPARIVELDQLPLTPNGKVDRKALSEQRLQGRLTTADTGEVGVLKALVESVTGVVIKDPTASLFDHGVHSLQIVRLAAVISERFGAAVKPADIYTHSSLCDLERLLGTTSTEPSASAWSVAGTLRQLCGKHRVPAAQVAAVSAGDVLLFNHGIEESAGALPPSRRGFRLSCNLKLLTLLVALRLAEQGKLALDDMVVDRVPGWQENDAWDGVRIEHLLAHTHGLDFALDIDALDADAPLSELARSCATDARRMFAPGSMYGYSMVGHTVVAYICELVCGLGFQELLSREVLDPLGIRLLVDDEVTAGNAVLEGHLHAPDGPVPVSPPRHVAALLPSGALGAYLPAQDLLRVGLALVPASLGGSRLLADETIAGIYARPVPIENHPILCASALSVVQMENGFWGHLGDGDGQHMSLQVDPLSGRALACAAAVYPAATLFGEVAGKLFPSSDAPPRLEFTQAPTPATVAIHGEYSNSTATVETVRLDGGYAIRVQPSRDADGPREYRLIEVDPGRTIFRLAAPDRTVKGSVTYFENQQGRFMRVGQILLKKTGE